MMCTIALMNDAVLRQRDDVHGCSDGRCCAEDSGMMCMIAMMNDTVLRTARMMCMIALLKDDVLMAARLCAR